MVYAQLDIRNAFPPASQFNDVADILNLIFPLIITIGGLLLVANVVIMGFSMIRAGGDPERLKKIQERIKYMLIGISIVIAAYAIIRLVQRVFGLPVIFQ